MHKALIKQSLPFLLIASIFHPVKARAVDPITVVGGALVGAVGCGAYFFLRAFRRESAKQDGIDNLARVLMALRGSQNAELFTLLKAALVTHAGDSEKIQSLMISQYYDDQTVIARLLWQLPLMEPRRSPDLLPWLEFEELASAREIWKQLQSFGWKVSYQLPRERSLPGDSMFQIDGKKRLVVFCTTPYIASGPIAAAWAVFSAEAAEKTQNNSVKLRTWIEALRVKHQLNDSEAAVQSVVMPYLHKSATWKKTAEVYHPFAAAHPEHKSWFWDGHLFDSKTDRARNFHVLSTQGVVPRAGFTEFLEELVATDLDAIIAAP